jgi:hypothetical protein
MLLEFSTVCLVVDAFGECADLGEVLNILTEMQM